MRRAVVRPIARAARAALSAVTHARSRRRLSLSTRGAASGGWQGGCGWAGAGGLQQAPSCGGVGGAVDPALAGAPMLAQAHDAPRVALAALLDGATLAWGSPRMGQGGMSALGGSRWAGWADALALDALGPLGARRVVVS